MTNSPAGTKTMSRATFCDNGSFIPAGRPVAFWRCLASSASKGQPGTAGTCVCRVTGAGRTNATGRGFGSRLPSSSPGNPPGVFRPIGELGPHAQPPLLLVAVAAAGLVPGAEVGHVEVDPGNQPVPGLGVELDVVMALLEHLDQFAGAGVPLQRLLQEVIALRPGPATNGCSAT